MSKVKIKLNRSEIREFLKSEDTEQILMSVANPIVSANKGFKADSYKGKNRSNVAIYAYTKKAYKDNLKNNTLLKAVKA